MPLPDPRYADDLPVIAMQVIDDVCVEFERAWRAGDRPAIEDLLCGADGIEREALLRELLAVELEVRTHRQESARAEQYHARFPHDGELVRLAFAELQSGPVAEPRVWEDTATLAARGEGSRSEASTDAGRRGAGAQASPLTIGDVVAGDYLLLAEIGAGGMGAVYKARHLQLDKIVALKVLGADRRHDAAAVARFRREQQAAGRLDHLHIVAATDAREADGCLILAMEYLDGADLGKLVKARGALRVEDACEIIRQAALGLQHAHEAGLVHRDIKPSNLMLTRGGVVKVLDLGLARLLGESAGAEHSTEVGQVLGTYDYMAPEQWDDVRGVDIRADIYGLGCTLYHLLAGRPPYCGENFNSLARKLNGHLHVPPPPLDAARADLPAGLWPVVSKALAKNRDERYALPADFAGALAPFASGVRLAELLPAPPGEAPAQSSLLAPAHSRPGEATASPSGLGMATSSRWSKILGSYRNQLAMVVTGVAVLGLALVAFWPSSGPRQVAQGDRNDADESKLAASPKGHAGDPPSDAAKPSPQDPLEIAVDIPGPVQPTAADSEETIPGPVDPEMPVDANPLPKAVDEPPRVKAWGLFDANELPLRGSLDDKNSFDLLAPPVDLSMAANSMHGMQIEFDRPVYCYLVQFLPVDGAAPVRFRQVELAGEAPAASFITLAPISAEEPGQHAFAVVASAHPLPPFADWSVCLEEAPWGKLPARAPAAVGGDRPGPAPAELQALRDYLQSHAGADAWYVLELPAAPPERP